MSFYWIVGSLMQFFLAAAAPLPCAMLQICLPTHNEGGNVFFVHQQRKGAPLHHMMMIVNNNKNAFLKRQIYSQFLPDRSLDGQIPN